VVEDSVKLAAPLWQLSPRLTSFGSGLGPCAEAWPGCARKEEGH
jgi:hypothetical protein